MIQELPIAGTTELPSTSEVLVPPPRELPLVAGRGGDPRDAMEVYAISRENGIDWSFQHPSGYRETNQLHLPLNENIRFIATAIDNPSQLKIYSFGILVDAIGGQYRHSQVFKPNKTGEFRLWSNTNHIGTVHVMELEGYRNIIAGEPEDAVPTPGRQLFVKYKCNLCHSGKRDSRGPILERLFESRVPLRDGGVAIADEDYIMESILKPKAKVREGWEPIMPSYQGQITDDELSKLVGYVKSLRDAKPR